MASAGPDIDVSFGNQVVLNASRSFDPSGGALEYTWTQVLGPDVTGGVGVFKGVSPSFSAPFTVASVLLDLIVQGPSGTSAPDRLQINILENRDQALFVSPSGNDGNPGTREQPLRTLTEARGRVALLGGGKDLYVAAGNYSVTFDLVNASSLYGGFQEASWVRDAARYVTRVAGTPYALAGTGVGSLTIDGLALEGAAPAASGSSAYGARLSDTSNITLSKNSITAGSGVAGADGSPGQAGAAGQAGATGQPGVESSSGACDSGAQPVGGAGGNGAFAGGNGGNAGHGTNSGQAGQSGSGPGGGAGGPGVPPGQGNTAPDLFYAGGDGLAGTAGPHGSAGQSFGLGGAALYQPSDGAGGAAGTAGSGGGGGGGGGGGTNACDSYGSSGGGGGGGGHGGQGGAPGRGGGGSFGIWVHNSRGIQIFGNAITTGGGGRGGNGGVGGAGGPGGNGGARGPYGGQNDQDDGSNGAPGGRGGAGGAGGASGGGGGGPSIGIQEDAASDSVRTDNTFALGSGGAGGSSPGNPGAIGMSTEFRKG